MESINYSASNEHDLSIENPSNLLVNSNSISEPEENVNESLQNENHILLLADTNLILSMIDVFSKKITTIDELKNVASSMFVAIYESLFSTKLSNVIRDPLTQEDYIYNAQMVIDGLCERIHIDLHHITGYAIVTGDLLAISDLVSIFIRIANITGRNDGMKAMTVDDIPGTPISSVSKDSSITPTKSSLSSTKLTSSSKTISSKTKSKSSTSKKLSKPKREGKVNQTLSLSTVKDVDLSIAYDGISKLLKSNESMILQAEKLDAAKYRRDQGLYFKELAARRVNRQKADRTNRILQQRKYQDIAMKNKSTEIRSTNEDFVVLRKIYQGLMKRLYLWRNEQKLEAKGREEATKEEILKFTKSLQSLFEDRVELYKLKRFEMENNLKTDFIDAKKYESSLRSFIKSEFQKLFDKSNSDLEQLNQLKKMTRMQGYHNILDMLLVEKDWENSLRRGLSGFD